MEIREIEIGLLKPNPNNPRTIKDADFKQLVESIKSFPEMLKIRPIVVNKDYIVLGGNRRLDACKAAGMVVVPTIVAESLTPEQEKEFVVKDNVSAGEWDFEMLANGDWGKADEWGLDFPVTRTKKEKAEPEAGASDICPTCGK